MIEMKNEAVMSLNIPCRQIHFAEHSCGESARARAPFSRPSPSELLRGATPAAQLKGRGISTSEVKGSLADALAAARPPHAAHARRLHDRAHDAKERAQRRLCGRVASERGVGGLVGEVDEVLRLATAEV